MNVFLKLFFTFTFISGRILSVDRNLPLNDYSDCIHYKRESSYLLDDRSKGDVCVQKVL